jgi:hypothetical protein
LTDAEWQVLAQAGYVAVHNPNPKANDVKRAAKVVESTVQHHVFNTFRWSDRASFWTQLFDGELDPDDFVVPFTASKHQQVSNAITQAWREFIDTNSPLLQNASKAQKMQIRKATFEKMFDLADQYGYDVSQVRRYNTTEVLGHRLEKLYVLARKSGMEDFSKNRRFLTSIARVLKRIPAAKLAQMMPYVATALTVYSVAETASGYYEDPAQALAATLDISRGQAQSIIEGRVAVHFSNIWTNGLEVDGAVLTDDTQVSRGDFFYIYDWETRLVPKDGEPNVWLYKPFYTWSAYLPVKRIELGDTPGKVVMVFDVTSANGNLVERKFDMDRNYPVPTEVINSN